MKGYWHFAALSVVTSALTIIFSRYYFIIALFLWLFYLFYTERLGKRPLLVSLICFLFFTIYIPQIEIESTLIKSSEQNDVINGEIITPTSIKLSKVEFTLREAQSNKNILVLYFPDKHDTEVKLTDYDHLKHGARCQIKGTLELPAGSRNPGQFDYQVFLASKGISYQIIVDSIDQVECTDGSFSNHIYESRLGLIDYVRNTMSDESSSWITALVLGDDSYLDAKTVELFQRWSLSHILAISGLHVGLIVALVYFILVKLSIVTKETAQWIMIIFLPFYALIAGGQPSVWRASTMVLLFIIFNKTKLKYSAVDTLSLVFIILIVFNKYIVYHVGFQLSFVVTLGLILSRQLLAQTNSNILQVLQISFISQMMILPLQLAYFSTFQPLSIILNVIVVPYFSLFVIPLMFLMVLFSPISNLLIKIMDLTFVTVHQLFLASIQWIDQIAYFPLIIGNIPVFIAVVYYIVFFIFMKHLQLNKLASAFKYGLSMVCIIISSAIWPYLSPNGTVTMLDIGQGDAFVIELPYRKGVFLIDAGSGFSFEDFEPTKTVYQQIIKPYLYSQGIGKLDAIFLSHEHVDHNGSVSYILDEMEVGEIIVSNYYELDDYFEKKWGEYDVPINRVNIDQQISLNGQQFHVLAPSRNIDANENSLVLYTKIGGLYWLFTGDIYQSTEKEIINLYSNLKVDVLKVAHHGSNTSTAEEFLMQINPTYALIPVGVNNRYGHPTKEVLDSLEDQSVTILRTDQDGAVQFRFKSKSGGTFLKYLP